MVEPLADLIGLKILTIVGTLVCLDTPYGSYWHGNQISKLLLHTLVELGVIFIVKLAECPNFIPNAWGQ